MARRSREEAFETREKILESALDTMSSQSFSSVSMSGIAEKIGLSKGAVYWHFKNRSDLLVHLLENLAARVDNELKIDGGILDSLDDLRRFLKNRMEKAARSERFKSMHRLMMRQYEWPEEIQEKVRVLVLGKIEQECDMLEKCLAGLQERGKIRGDVAPRKLAEILCAVFHGIFIAQLTEMWPQDFSSHVDFIIHSLIEGRNAAKCRQTVCEREGAQ